MLQGEIFSIWTLDQEGTTGDEVRIFLEDIGSAKNGKAAIALNARIRHMADHQQAGLSKEIRDCWEEDDETFCELKKDPYRISYTVFGTERRILLATVFRKHGMKAKQEYRRALSLFREFRSNMRWNRRSL